MAEEKNGATETPGEPVNNQTPKPLTLEEVQKLIQSETDKVRTKYVNELKALESEKEALLKEKMSEKEKADFELQKKAKEIEERENLLNKQTLSLKKLNLLKDNTSLLDLEEFISGDNEDQLKENMQKLKTKFEVAVQKEVEKRFKENGRDVTQNNNNSLDTITSLKQQHAEAIKANDTHRAVELKNKIWALEHK